MKAIEVSPNGRHARQARLCPIIDSPCSTPPSFAHGQVSAFCSGCQKTVYNLSAMTAPAQTQLLLGNESLCVRYRKILPAAAFALAIASTANGAELNSAPLVNNESQVARSAVDQEQSLEAVIVGGASGGLESLFLESELDQSLDEFADQELDDGAKQ
jgi:hypothetical protein